MPDDQYRIIATPIVTYRDTSGQIVEGREIDFLDLVSGHTGRVRLPASQYTAAHVDAKVKAELAHIRAVANLGQPELS